jgi:hypothetical protein
VRFLVLSDTYAPQAITQKLNLIPDEMQPKGSRFQGPPARPVSHIWVIESGLPDEVPLDAHFERIMDRIASHAQEIRDLLDDRATKATFQVFREFLSGPEDRDVREEADGARDRLHLVQEPGAKTIDRVVGRDFDRLRGQHSLLGFHLGSDVLAFAASSGVEFDFDEYGDEYE